MRWRRLVSNRRLEVLILAQRTFGGWPAANQADVCDVRPLRPHCWWIGYTGPCPEPFHARRMLDEEHAPPNLDLELDGPIAYLLHIYIPPHLRGQGLGQRLYELCEELARRAGCVEIRQTPSGRTCQGDLREVYLARRGWRISLADGAASKSLNRD